MSRTSTSTTRPAGKELAVPAAVPFALLAMASAPFGVLPHAVESVLRTIALFVFMYYTFFRRKTKASRRRYVIVMPVWALLTMIVTTFGFWYWLYTLSAGFLLIGILTFIVAAGYLAD